MKKTLSLFLAVLMLLSVFSIPSFAASEGDYIYSEVNGSVTITEYSGTDKNVVIPDTLGGLPVTCIDEYAFAENDYIQTVVVPEGVTTINEGAFSTCENLKSIQLPSTVSDIYDPFFDSYSLAEINVAEGNKEFKSINGVVFDAGVTAVYLYPPAKADKVYTIPSTVKAISDGAFAGVENLTEVKFPSSLTTIGVYAFALCENLSKAVIPNSVKTIGEYAFAMCGLTSVTISKNVKTINEAAFALNPLKNVTIPSGVTKIGEMAFGATDIKYAVIPSSVKSIAASAFDGCEYMSYILGEKGSYAEKYAKNIGLKFNYLQKPKVKTAVGAYSVKLSWNKINGATGYRIYQYNTKTKKYTGIANTSSLSYLIKDKKPNTNYYYLVRAYRQGGNATVFSPFTSKDNVKCTTLCAAPKVTVKNGTTSIKLSWGKVSGATGYRIYQYNPSTKKYTGIANTTSLSYLIKNKKPGTNYYYLVRAYKKSGKSVLYSPYTTANNVKCTTLCSAPSVKASAGKNQIKLSWAKVKGASSYIVYSYNPSTKQYKCLKNNLNALSFTQTGLKPNTTYRYLVRARNSSGLSGYSVKNVISVKTKR